MGNKQLNILISYAFLICYCLPTNALPGWCNLILTAGKWAGLLWAVLIFLVCRVYENKRLWPIWAFLAFSACSSFINHTSLTVCLRFAYPIFACCVITYHLIFLCKSKALNYIAVLFSLLTIAQGFTAIIGGMGSVIDGNGIPYTLYFFGDRVSISYILTYAIALSALALKTSRRTESWLHILSIASCIYFSLYESVSTAVMSIAVFAAVLIGGRIVRKERLWYGASIAIYLFSLLFVISGGLTNGFEWLLNDILGEGITLNGRTLLWEQALKFMNGWHWLLGNGYAHPYRFYIGDWSVDTAHSQYMNILFCFGFAGIFLYSIMCWQNLNAAKRTPDTECRLIIIAALAAIIITGIPTTMFKHVYIYIYFVVIMFFDYIIDIDTMEKKRLSRRRIKITA